MIPNGYKILIVDDEPQLANIIADVLELSGYNCIQANSGVEGLEKAR
ncbi:MAG: hypothetical protein HN929_02795 [Chloroflexi bacterium]|jgi:DNA-binding response OmpR family regulator|nr:hypothetical protein [Chloroflexota bacterium]